MDNTFRRIVSFVMAMAIVLSIGGLNVLAITEEDEAILNFGASNVTVTKSNEEQPVSISFYISEDAEIASFGVQNISISDPNQMGVTFAGNAVVANTSFSGVNNIEAGSTTGGITMSDITAGHHMAYSSELNGYVLFTLPLTIPANATGTATVTFSQISAADYETGDGYSVNSTPVTATITISEPVDEDAFEVYYQIEDTIVDTDNDRVHEVDPDAVFTVGVYVKAGSAKVMQAFDIYPDWDAQLEYVSVAGVENVTTITDQMSAANPHFMTNLTDDTDGTDVGITTDGTKVATLTMKLRDTNDAPVVYDTPYHIWIASASNLAQANDPESVKKVTYTAEDTFGVETRKTYKVHYDDGVGETETAVEVPDDQDKLHGVELTLGTLEENVREGWKFTGWNTLEDGTGVSYAGGAKYTANAGVTLYAQWKKDTFPVTFNLNGQPNATPAPGTQNVVNGAKVEKPADPSVTGYTFGGWYTDVACSEGKEFDFENTAITQATELFAKWTINSYKVTYHMNGHGTEIGVQTVPYNTTITAPAAPTATGYTFGGWYTEQACENQFNFTTPITKDTELFAKWTSVEVTVTLNVNGGDALPDDQKTITVTYGDQYTYLPTDLNKAGYTFDGWFTQATGGDQVTNETEVKNADDHELFAHWTANTYYVKFNANGGKGTMENQKFTYGADKVALSENLFTHDDPNYVFAGWATSSDGEVVYTDKAGVQDLTAEPNGVVELFAIWKQDVYKINYSSNPAEIGMSTDGLEGTYSSAEGYTITTEPTADGYTFTGWSTTTSGVTVSADGKTVMIPKNHTGAVDLTANFDVNQYTITFADTGDTTYEPITKNYGEAVGTVADPTKTGYTFAGWSETIPTTMPAKNMTITANWTINQYTITFADTGDTTYEPITKDYGEAVGTVADPTKTGYTFAGWSETIPTTMPAENKTITATWTEHTYDITYDKSDDVSYADTVKDQDDVKYSDEVTLPKTEEVTKPGYTLVGWDKDNDGGKDYEPGATTSGLVTENGGSITLYPVWTEAEYTVTFDLGAHPATDATVPPEINVTYKGAYSGLTDVASATGYNFTGWSIDGNTIQNDATVEITKDSTAIAQYEAIEYTITYNANGGTVDTTGASVTYTIETTTLTLPTPTWENHTFNGWYVEETIGSWNKDSQFSTSLNKAWGNVKVYAQWESSVTTVVEDYKYAMDGYVMLRIPADNNDKARTFNGEKMFYTDDGEYKIDGKAVFVTLIPKDNGQEGDALVSYVADSKLTDAGLAMLGWAEDGATPIDRTSGKINMKDDIVNIADANAVYQMVENGGKYYNETQLSIEKRLMADMDTELTNAENRGSLKDVNEIVKLINEKANSTN